MSGKKSKLMRRMAEQITIGKSLTDTRRVYKQLKSVYKPNKV